MKRPVDVCYLCGESLDADTDRDHVPPAQLYPKQVRTSQALNLFTLPVHRRCNASYQHDEDYFFSSLSPLAANSHVGGAIWADLRRRVTRPEGRRLARQVLKEFEERPSGVVLPEGKVAKRFDPKRVRRVVWKICRGLFFKVGGRFLPEGVPRCFWIFLSTEKPPPELGLFLAARPRGDHPGVFDYMYIEDTGIDNFHFWALLFWNTLVTLIAFHDADCRCARCAGAVGR